MMKRGLLFVACTLISGYVCAQIAKEYSFLDTSSNHFQAHQASLIGSLTEQIAQRNTPSFSVLHIGDELVRDVAQPLGEGLFGKTRGLGLFFPSSLINNSVYADIENRHTGYWIYATPIENNPLLSAGITGYAAKTEDWRASLTVEIPAAYGKNVDRFSMLCERSEQHFDVMVSCMGGKKADGTPILLSKKEFPASISYKNSPYLEFALPLGTKEIVIQFKQVISTQKSFVLHGIALTNSKQGNLHSIGMRGCGYLQFNRLELLKQQLIQLSPNVILLDFGMHDNYRGNEEETVFLEPIKRSIQILKEAVPSSKIVVVVPQDGIRGGRTLSTFEKYEKAIIALCKTEKVIYYDWYRVAGGKYAAQYWADFQLFMVDGLHLQEAGNSLKGQLYGTAWENTARRYNNGYRQFIIAEDSSKRLAFRTRDTLTKNIVVSEVWRYHVVRRGETAYRIALRYGITVAQLKEWNHLRSYNISAGTRLKVGKLSIATKSDPIQTLEMKDSADADGSISLSPNIDPPKTQDTAQTVVPQKPTPAPVAPKPRPVYHKVRSGETLYSIAKAYGSTVEDVKRMNGLRSNNIAVGRLLRVR